MSFLLKIVQGPNAGAEIALAEGVNLSFGSADDCDIILSDSSVAGKAFELEVSGERVVAVMDGGKAVKLEPYHVTVIGTTAIALGPQEGTWKSLVWPKAEKPGPSPVADEEETPPAEEKPKKKRRGFGCIVVLVLFTAIALAAAYSYWKYPDKTREYALKSRDFLKSVWVKTVDKVKSMKSAPPVAAPKESLEAVAADCGFSVKSEGGKILAKGDFKTRVERLEATARAYAASPGLKIDFSDRESLGAAVGELLQLVTGGALRLVKIEGRKAFVSGYAPSRGALEKAMRALSEDVPKIAAVDCSRVVLGVVDTPVAAQGDGNAAKAIADKSARTNDVAAVAEKKETVASYKVPKMKRFDRGIAALSRTGAPQMPVVGILTVPYPCLVLSDGTRAMEGARFGDFTIEKIEADRVTVRGADGSFEWRP